MALKDWFKKRGTTPPVTSGAGYTAVQEGIKQYETSTTKTGTSISSSEGVQSVSPTAPTPPKPNRNGGGGQSVHDVVTGETYTITEQGTKTPIVAATPKPNLVIEKSGGVRYGGRTYYGNANIDAIGMTANEYRQSVLSRLNQNRLQGTRAIGQGRFTSQTYTGWRDIGGGEKVYYNQYGEPTKIESKALGRTFNSVQEYKDAIREYSKANLKNYLNYQSTSYSPEQSKVERDIREAVANRRNFVGVGVLGTPAFISVKDIKEKDYIPIATENLFKNFKPIPIPNKFQSVYENTSGKAGRFVGETAEVLIPETPEGVAIAGATAGLGLYGNLPIRAGLTVASTTLGTAGALNKNLTPQERVASGIVGGIGATGLFFESVPFLRSFGARFSLNKGKIPMIKTNELYSPVRIQEEGFKAVETKDYRIGLIPAGSPSTAQPPALIDYMTIPKTSPLRRGGFSSPLSEKKIYLYPNQKVATSQIGLFKEGMNLPLEREFFVTPQEVTLNIPQARMSRLGLTELWKFPKESSVGFGFPKQAQIGVEEGASITRTGIGGSYKIGTTTELEAIKSVGTSITDVKLIGTTIIKGQGVDIYSFKTTGSNTINRLGTTQTTSVTTRISGESLIATTLIPQKNLINYPTIRTTISRGLPSNPLVIQLSPNISSTTSVTGTRKISGGYGNTNKTNIPTNPIYIVPTYPKPETPRLPITPKRTTPYPNTKPPRTPTIIKRILPIGEIKSKPRIQEGFGVQVRRFGKWISVGKGISLEKAFNVGRFQTQGGLSQSFRIVGGKASAIPKGYYLSKREKGVYIELPKTKINTPSEKELLKVSRKKRRIKRSGNRR